MTLINYVKLGNFTKAQELITSGVNLNHQDEYGYTALIWAASYSKPDMVKLLLDAGADKDITDVNNHSALYWANYYKNKEIISLLDDKPVLTKKKKGK